MDNTSDTAQWSTPLPVGFAALIGAVVLGVAAGASSAEPAGLAIMGIAALLLAGIGICALVLRPRLAVESDELRVRSLLMRGLFRADQIERIRVVSTPRLGRRVPTLEVDLPGDRLVVMGRWDLGAHPDDVAARLRQAGFRVE